MSEHADPLSVDTTITQVLLPMAYQLINDLADLQPLDQELRVRVGKMLPAKYTHSFAYVKDDLP